MSQDEQTNGGDYEAIRYKTFQPVSYPRHMSWKTLEAAEAAEVGDQIGRIGIGKDRIILQTFDIEPGREMDLPEGWFVIVGFAKFKLVRKT